MYLVIALAGVGEHGVGRDEHHRLLGGQLHLLAVTQSSSFEPVHASLCMDTAGRPSIPREQPPTTDSAEDEETEGSTPQTFSLEVNLTRKRSSIAANCRNCACVFLCVHV